MKINPIGCIHLFSGSHVKIGQRDFSGRMFAQDPEGLSGDRIVLSGDAMAVAKDKRSRLRRLVRRERGARVSSGVGLALLLAHGLHFVGQSLQLDCKLDVIAVVAVFGYHDGLLLRRRPVIAIVETGNVRGPVKRKAQTKAGAKEEWVIEEEWIAAMEPVKASAAKAKRSKVVDAKSTGNDGPP